MGAIAQLGMQAASGVVGGIEGAIFGGINDRRQLKQQQKLQDMQIRGQKEMANYNYELQNAMWHATNVGAQVAEYEKAGLNPGLMYGMGGGGGTTVGSQGGSVTGAQAPSGGGEMTAMTGMGIQSAMNIKLMEQQAEVLKSQANLNNVEAAKKAGVDTKLVEAQTENAWQGLENARNANDIQRLQKTMMNIENYEKQASQHDRLDYITYQAKIAAKTLLSAGAQANVDQSTINEKIKIIQQQAIGAVLQNELTQNQINLTKEQITKISNEIAQGWENLSQNDRRIKLQSWEDEIKAQFPGIGQVGGKLMNNVLEGIDEIFRNSKGTNRTYDVPDKIKQ